MQQTLALAQPATHANAPSVPGVPAPVAPWLPSLPVLLIASGLVLMAVLLAWASRAARAGGRAPAVAQHAPSDAQARELALLYKQAAADLDVRLERMERLLGQADERIAQLQTVPSERGAPAPTGADQGGPTDQAQPGASQRATATPTHSHAHADDTARQVYALADAGRSPVQIAQQLGTHTGKVQLILALRQG